MAAHAGGGSVNDMLDALTSLELDALAADVRAAQARRAGGLAAQVKAELGLDLGADARGVQALDVVPRDVRQVRAHVLAVAILVDAQLGRRGSGPEPGHGVQ